MVTQSKHDNEGSSVVTREEKKQHYQKDHKNSENIAIYSFNLFLFFFFFFCIYDGNIFSKIKKKILQSMELDLFSPMLNVKSSLSLFIN